MSLKSSVQPEVNIKQEELKTDGEEKPLYQRWYAYIVYLTLGFVALGTLLDAAGNSLTLVTPFFTYVGSAFILLVWGLTEGYLRFYPSRWIIPSGEQVKIKKTGIGIRLFLLGAIALLFFPRITDMLKVSTNGNDQAAIQQVGQEQVEEEFELEGMVRDGDQGSGKVELTQIGGGGATANSDSAGRFRIRVKKKLNEYVRIKAFKEGYAIWEEYVDQKSGLIIQLKR